MDDKLIDSIIPASIATMSLTLKELSSLLRWDKCLDTSPTTITWIKITVWDEPWYPVDFKWPKLGHSSRDGDLLTNKVSFNLEGLYYYIIIIKLIKIEDYVYIIYYHCYMYDMNIILHTIHVYLWIN